MGYVFSFVLFLLLDAQFGNYKRENELISSFRFQTEKVFKKRCISSFGLAEMKGNRNYPKLQGATQITLMDMSTSVV